MKILNSVLFKINDQGFQIITGLYMDLMRKWMVQYTERIKLDKNFESLLLSVPVNIMNKSKLFCSAILVNFDEKTGKF